MQEILLIFLVYCTTWLEKSTMNLDAVHEMPSFGDQTMMPVHNNIIDENGKEIIYEAAYSYDELFPSLPDNEVKPAVPVVDMGQWTQKMKVKSSVITQVILKL